MKDAPRHGLLVMHYGTPRTLDEVEPYYTHIRRGRSPSPEQLEDLVRRYKAIGGPSPLAHISRRQGEMIADAMAKNGFEVKLYMGQKHAAPFISDAVDEMQEDGIEKAVGIVLAPHYSSMSVGSYRAYAHDALADLKSPMHFCVLERWGTLPALIDGLARRVQTAIGEWPKEETLVVFTAHSLPARILEEGDPYKDELLETAGLVARKLDLPHWRFAFQSASGTGEPWLGPDLLEVLDEVARGSIRKVVACTVGFVSDHLEVLYDLGIEAKERASELGLEFRVAECINEDPDVMGALAKLAAALF